MDSELIPWPVQLIKACSEKRSTSGIALSAGSINWGFGELIDRVFHLTRILKSEFGIKRGMRVMTAYPDTSVGWIGFCLLQISLGQLGVCFTVMDTRSRSLTEKARSYVIELFQPNFYIPISGIQVNHASLPSALSLNWNELVFGAINESIFDEPLCELDDGAFVDWTSGSTGGFPKGCVTTHRTLAKMYVQKWKNGFLSNSTPVSPVGCNLFFLWYWWQPICHAAHSVVILDSELRDVSLLRKCVELHSIAVIDCITPSLLKVLCESGVATATVLVSGEALPVNTAALFVRTFPQSRLFNVFSTTETGDAAMVQITSTLVTKWSTNGLEVCPIGRALFGVELVVSGEELIVAGTGAREYLGDALATQKGFNDIGWMSRDRVIEVEEGFVILNRLDECVKVRGFKIDLRAIEQEAETIVGVVAAAAVATEDQIFLFVKLLDSSEDEVRVALQSKLAPSHMPQRIVVTPEFPLTRTGKLDRKSLLAEIPQLDESLTVNDEQTVTSRVLSVFRLFPLSFVTDELNSSFWTRGGTSLMAISICARLSVPVKLLMDSQVASPAELIAYLQGESVSYTPELVPAGTAEGVAIVGMSGRWPGIEGSARSLAIFEFLKSRKYSMGILDSNELVRGFDCAYWNLSVPSATKLDPHQRVFLEMALEALIDGGYFERKKILHCGVFAAGGSLSHYLQLLTSGENIDTIRDKDPARYLELELGCDKDYIALRTAKMLNLTGPAMTVQAACASGLVAIAQAAAAIRSGECSLAIAGGISLALGADGQAGHVPGVIWSSDGRCRPFDEGANGTVNSNAGHVFLLKNLALARQDGDAIYGVIEGTAVVNDGNRGKDFVAPSVSGHVEAIRKALTSAGRSPAEVQLVEAHGTGTPMGDPMEYSAFTEAYISGRDAVLSVGSVKGNVGHANTAAGAVGLGKIATALFHRCLFPSGSFEKMNRNIITHPLVKIQAEFEQLAYPLIAGISSLGMGGTNCHLIVASDDGSKGNSPFLSPDESLWICSGHSVKAVEAFWAQLPTRDSVGVASTLAHHRDHVSHAKFRRAIFGGTEAPLSPPVECIPNAERIVLLFPGQGGAWPENGCITDPEIVRLLGRDPCQKMNDQLALFCLQYTVGKAILRLAPTGRKISVCGHSIGEYAAAVLAGELGLLNALGIVEKRAELLQQCGGKMALVMATAADVLRVLAVNSEWKVEIACYNRSDRITVAGNEEDISLFIQRSGLVCKMLPTSGAFHSSLTEPAVAELARFIAGMDMTKNNPNKDIQWISSLTGSVVEKIEPDHWCAHTRKPVLFTQCVQLLSNEEPKLFVDVGNMLGPLLPKSSKVATLRGETRPQQVAAKLWEFGLNVDLGIPKLDTRVLGLPTIGWDRSDCWPEKLRVEKFISSATNVEQPSSIAIREVWVPVVLDLSDSLPVVYYDMNNNTSEYLASTVRAAFEDGTPIVVRFDDSNGTIEQQCACAMRCLEIIQAFARARSQIDRIVVVSLTIETEYGPVVGIVRCAQTEHPDLGIVLVRGGKQLPCMLSGNEYRVDALGQYTVRRLEPVADFASFPAASFPAHGKYLVTGGLGGIGQELVEWLLKVQCAKRVVILARRKADNIASWPTNIVQILACDFQNMDEHIRQIVSNTEWTCVFHLAGQVKDGLVANVSHNLEEFMAVSAGKILGIYCLLDIVPTTCKIVCFSSTSGMLGSPGQALYAAANTALDALASNRVVAIQWGGWAASVKNSMSDRFGLAPLEGCERFLSIEQGLESMMKVMGSGNSLMGIADIYDWRKYTEKAHLNKRLTCEMIGPGFNWLVSEEQVEMGQHEWLTDHRDESGPLVPATALIGAALSHTAIENMRFLEPLRLGRFVQIDQIGQTLVVRSSTNNAEPWVLHASATVQTDNVFPESIQSLLNALNRPNTSWEPISVDKLYSALSNGGFEYGPYFKRVRNIFLSDSGIAVARVEANEKPIDHRSGSVYYEHAAVLDACTHISSVLDPRASSAFPSAVKRVSQHATNSSSRNMLEGIMRSTSKKDWYVVMRLSPLLVGPAFSEKVCVDLAAISDELTICFEEFELTPIETSNENVLVLTVDDEARINLANKLDRPISVNLSTLFSIEISAPMQTRRVPQSAGGFVETKAWGLSFLDVLAAKGVMSGALFGGEFAGQVVEATRDFQVGDRVMGLCSGGLSVQVSSDFVVKIPDHVSFLEAATLPVSFATALFALDRASIKSGAVVVVHNATGALGMALIRILNVRKDLKILATCSSGKESCLPNAVWKVLDSRNPASWPQTVSDNSIDVSIGAMHPDILHALIPLMKSFGVIVDVGKRLQVENTLLGLGPFARGLTYTTAHLDELMRVDKAHVNKLLLEAANFAFLPFKKYAVADLDEALHFLASGQHVGKVVIDMHASGAVALEGENLLDWEMRRLFGNRQWSKKSLNLSDLSCATLLTDEKLSEEQILKSLSLCVVPQNSTAVIVCRESRLAGPHAVPAAFREVRKQVLQQQHVGDDEKTWLQNFVKTLIGEPPNLDLSLEQLGIDSLGRLQLWHMFRRQFPHSKASQISASIPLGSIFAKSAKISGPKWLALHGFRTSPAVIEHQLAELVTEMGVELVCPKAPHEARGPCPVDGQAGFEWWSATTNNLPYETGWIGNSGLQRSIDELETLCDKHKFVGVFGFSQGAGMAHHLIASGKVPKGVLFSPVAPAGRDWPQKLSDCSHKLVIIQDNDDKSIRGYPSTGLTIITHHDGHRIPHMNDILVRDIQKYVTQNQL